MKKVNNFKFDLNNHTYVLIINKIKARQVQLYVLAVLLLISL